MQEVPVTDQLTVDVVLTDGVRVLLIERAKDPFKGCLAFPGGRVDPGEGLVGAAVRELEEEVGLVLSCEVLEPMIVLDTPGRDPRPGHTAAHVFWCRVDSDTIGMAHAASDAAAVHLVDLDQIDLTRMAFDHAVALARLKEVLGD